MDTLIKMRTGTVETNAKALVNDGKKLAEALYNDGRDTINDAEQSVKEYSDSVLATIQANPLSAVLISGGIGFLLALILRK